MTDSRNRDEDAASAAEREGSSTKQDAALSAIEETEEVEDTDQDNDDQMQGEAPTG